MKSGSRLGAHRGDAVAARAQADHRRWVIEALEGRALLSVIAWTNRGADNFGVYGANAAVARGIVDRAISDWQKVVDNFNFTGSPNGSNYYALTLNAKNLGSNGERGEANASTVDTAKRPTSGYVNVDDDGGGFGWYFDPAITTSNGNPDDGEFIDAKTPFAAGFSGGSGSDFYRTVTHEIGHALGLSLQAGLRLRDLYATQTPTRDPNDTTQSLWIVGWTGSAAATFTANGGGHMFEGPTPAGTSYPVWPNDLMNPGRTVGLSTPFREIISDIDASILANVYGYSVHLPSTMHTLYASLRGNVLRVNGTSAADQIHLDWNSASGLVQVSVNGLEEDFKIADVGSVEIRGGAGADNVFVGDPGNANATTYTIDGTTFTRPNMPSVSFVDAGGADTLRFSVGSNSASVYVRSLGAFALTVQGSSYGDNLFLGTSSGAMASFVGSVAFEGGGGTDHLWITDSARSYAQHYYLTKTGVYAYDGSGFVASYDDAVEGVHLYGANVASTYDVQSTNCPVTINAGDGDDTFNLSGAGSLSGLVDPITVNAGNGGADRIVFDDSANTSSPSYTIAGHAFARTGTATVGYDAEIVELHTGAGNDQIGIGDTLAGTLTSIYGGAGNDQLVIGYYSFFVPSLLDNVNGSIYFDGQGGTADEVDLEDLSETVGRSFTLNATTVAASHMASVTFANAEQVGLDAGSGPDTITVRPSTTIGFRVNGGANTGGSDRLIATAVGSLTPLQTATSSTAGVFTLAGYKDIAYSNVEAFGAIAPSVISGLTVQGQYPLVYRFTFDSDVSASLTAGDVTVTNLMTNQLYTPAQIAWDAATKTATFSMTAIPADGNYRVRLIASGVTANGAAVASDYTFDTFYLAGDLNFDRKVDFSDLLALAKNYNSTGKTVSQGNADYSADGSVSFDDLLLLAKHYGAALAAPVAAAFDAAEPVSAAVPTRKRTVNDVIP